MKNRYVFWLIMLLTLILVMGACTPKTYLAPMQIHINPGDHVEQAAIAMDSHGISHITGVVDNRVVYYRTKLGAPILTLTMTMTGSGLLWKQYDPDIAVTDAGHAYLTWVEQRGTADKLACWRDIPFATDHPYYTNCRRLDSGNTTTGNVKVVSRGEIVYAVYDRQFEDDSLSSLRYKELTNTTNTGAVVDYGTVLENGHLFKFDMAIDENDYLHVVYTDHNGYAPYEPRLWIRSNVEIDLSNGDMTLIGFVIDGDALITDWAPSITFWEAPGGERLAIAYGWVSHATGEDVIFTAQCWPGSYGGYERVEQALPSSWQDHSTIGDIKLVGVEDSLVLSFIGDDNTAAGAYAQVYVKNANAETSTLLFPFTDTATWKTDLEIGKLTLRDETGSEEPVFAWLEFFGDPKRFYTAVNYTPPIKVFEASCGAGYERQGDIATNGVYYAGVMEACGDTWFSANAYLNHIPLIEN